MTDLERAQRRQQLDDFANAGNQPNQPQQPLPGGHALVRPTAGLVPMGAQPVARERDEGKVLQKLKQMAAAAGSDWYYRWPVRNTETGKTEYIEGPSIKLANEVLRLYGNCATEVREIDVGDAWVFYVRFTDFETGSSQERAFHQRKGQRSMKMKDADRQLDIAYQIGQSKAIRNVIVNCLGSFADYALEEARNSLVEKIGKDLASWRERTIQGIAKVPVELKRVERVIGRASKDWLAPDISQVISMLRSIADGMATIDETFPPDQTVETPEKPLPEETKSASAPADESDTNREQANSELQLGELTKEVTSEPQTDPAKLRAAFQAGVKSKKAGAPREPVPKDYGHGELRLSWFDGYDSV